MKRILEYHITEAYKDYTIRDFLSGIGCSHAVQVQLKKTPEGILKNGRWAYVSERLSVGDCLTLRLIEDVSSPNILPVEHPLAIVYEDDDILVINKPAGMPVHPSQGHHEHTLANAVCAYYHARNIPYVFRCVNRLDRDTTGLTVLAKHLFSSAVLNEAVANRTLRRTYLAIAEGDMPDHGTIDAPISRVADSTIMRQVSSDGARAVTHYQTICRANGLSLVSLRLETGRTHQIRVHLKHIGHPLIGDFLYNPGSLSQYKIKRQALHSHRLEFLHPITGKPLLFTAPLPDDMASLI